MWCQVIRSAAPVTQNHLSKPEDLMLQNATHLRKSTPGPPNSSDEHVSCTARATENASFQILFKCPHACHRFWKWYKTLTFCSLLTRCTIPCACHAKRHLNVKEWSEHAVLLTFWLRNVQIEEVSQNCCVFDVVNFEKWRSLAGFLRFWRCQVQTLRKSCRIAAFLMLSSSKPEDVSQKSFVFQAYRKTGR